ncbi:hypothetical protein CVT26_007148 [Gymnopilus dilepis]|uniref:Uncharacterized protein n=1 Tax=Gymnopilus dilepis TaxID=231916 RepID=A0A409W6J8_9AGAR|nr:hypothetical protein CVT26_007148 [Gymnopilus dilepis]
MADSNASIRRLKEDLERGLAETKRLRKELRERTTTVAEMLKQKRAKTSGHPAEVDNVVCWSKKTYRQLVQAGELFDTHRFGQMVELLERVDGTRQSANIHADVLKSIADLSRAGKEGRGIVDDESDKRT